jgi:peptidyl-prolyl cis-trans isomerase D
MLQSMRQLAHSWIVKGLMLFLIISFSIWGIGDIFRGNPMRRTVAKVGSITITVQDLDHHFKEALAQMRRSGNAELSERQAKKLGLFDKTLDGEIKRALVDQDIKRLGLDVDAQSVLKMVADQPQFRTKDGSFNKDLFLKLLQQQGLNERSFITEGQQDLTRQILLTALSGTRSVPQTEIDALYKARAQKRVLDVVTIDPTKITGISSPDDKALHDFYDKNPTLFTAPEYRGVTIAVLDTETLAADIAIADDQLKREYDAKKDQLATPEERDIVQVVVQNEAKAKHLAQSARSSGDLAAAANDSGENAVPLDQMEESNLLPELAKAVFSLAQNQISDPVKTQLGWHVVQVKKITPAGTPDFDKVKEKMRTDMRRDQAVESATKIVNQLDDELAAGHSLDDIADGLKLRLIKIPSIDATGLTPTGKEPVELPNKAVILKDIFALNTAESSPIEDDKKGSYYVAHVDEITPSAIKPFDQVKNAVVAAWKANEQLDKAQAEAQTIAQALRDGKLAASFANDQGISVRTSSPLSQLGDTDPLLPQEILTQTFKIKKGETAIALSERNQVIAQLVSIIDADPGAKDPRKNMIGGQIKQGLSGELLEQYIQHLYDVFPVKIDQALVDSLRGQDN